MKSAQGAGRETEAGGIRPAHGSRLRVTYPYIDWINRLAMEESDAMGSQPEWIMEDAEATPIQVDGLLRLGAPPAGSPGAVRLVRSERDQDVAMLNSAMSGA